VSTFSLIVTASMAQNVILVHFLGVWPYRAVVSSPRRSALVSLAVTCVLLWTSTLYAIVYRYVLERTGFVYLGTLTLALILVGTLLGAIHLGTYVAPYARRTLRQYAPIIVVNTTVFVVSLAIAPTVSRIVFVPVAALGAGVGLLIALVPIAAIRKHLERGRVPAVLRGDVSAYIATACAALAIQQIDRLFTQVISPLW
jgi:Na+-translocating ferredoxin:NAD+ oxidoreductase RnfA subunit